MIDPSGLDDFVSDSQPTKTKLFVNGSRNAISFSDDRLISLFLSVFLFEFTS